MADGVDDEWTVMRANAGFVSGKHGLAVAGKCGGQLDYSKVKVEDDNVKRAGHAAHQSVVRELNCK